MWAIRFDLFIYLGGGEEGVGGRRRRREKEEDSDSTFKMLWGRRREGQGEREGGHKKRTRKMLQQGITRNSFKEFMTNLTPLHTLFWPLFRVFSPLKTHQKEFLLAIDPFLIQNWEVSRAWNPRPMLEWHLWTVVFIIPHSLSFHDVLASISHFISAFFLQLRCTSFCWKSRGVFLPPSSRYCLHFVFVCMLVGEGVIEKGQNISVSAG